MQQFREDMPEMDLRIQSADRDLDLAGEGIPLGIRGGSPEDWPQYDREMLAREEIYPVCGASYLLRFDRLAQAEDLSSHRLIHLEEPYRAATTRSEWFRSVGLAGQRAPKGLSINDYVLVIQSVIEGQGIALGWRHLADGLVENGVLVRPTYHSIATGKGFPVAWPKNTVLSEAAQRARDWLTSQRKDVGVSSGSLG